MSIKTNRLLLVSLFAYLTTQAQTVQTAKSENIEFQNLLKQTGKAIFCDKFSSDWKKQWFLDGEKATVKSGKNRLIYKAGPLPENDAHHTVLWTKQVFEGDIRIDFDFIRLDTVSQYVNIIYLFASGSGVAPFSKDLSAWNKLREIPAMNTYFDHMNAYHISFAAFDVGNADPANDYIRARRYLPESGKGLAGTNMQPDYLRTGLFKTNHQYHICIIRKGKTIWMKISDRGNEKLCRWSTDKFPEITSGRIGLRLMGSRESVFANFRVHALKSN